MARTAPKASAVYRAAVAAADVITAPGTVTCTKQAGGGCTAATYNVKVVACNALGRTTPTAGNVAVTTETTNLTVRAAFAAVTGATHYDIYCSVDADPKWVGRITEAQRASGILITAVGVTGAGGAAGAVDVEVPGTGLQAATTAAVNTAYVLPTLVDPDEYEYVDFDISASRTGDAAAAACVVVPFWYNDRTTTLFSGTPVTLTFGGAAGVYDALQQTVRVQARGRSVGLIVQSISGTGMALDIDAVLN